MLRFVFSKHKYNAYVYKARVTTAWVRTSTRNGYFRHIFVFLNSYIIEKSSWTCVELVALCTQLHNIGLYSESL